MTNLATTKSPHADLRVSALAMAAEGRFMDAIALATAHNRACADAELESLLVVWRMAAFATQPKAMPDPDWPGKIEDPFRGVSGLPEIQAAQLTSEILAGAIVHHGALLVRGLVPTEEASQFAAGIDRAMTDFTAWFADQSRASTPWFTAAPDSESGSIEQNRQWVISSGGVWAVDSPRMLFELTELLERTGVIDVVSGYLTERPALSARKTTLRKVPANQKGTGWHQDGAFMGKDIRSVNVWVALSDCGRDAPGIDLLPKRIPYIVETGTQGALLNWMVGPGMVETLAKDAPVVSPEFAAGDALLFDHFFLHRTGLPPNCSKDRFAIEAWMFAPSCYPMKHEPMVL
jgi:hypothetical protein